MEEYKLFLQNLLNFLTFIDKNKKPVFNYYSVAIPIEVMTKLPELIKTTADILSGLITIQHKLSEKEFNKLVKQLNELKESVNKK